MKKSTILLSAVCALMALVGTVKATTLDFGDSRDLGFLTPAHPTGDADEVNYVNHLIGMSLNSTDSFSGQDFTRYGTSCGACTPISAVSTKDESGNNTVDLGSGGFLYLYAKYDGQNGGSEVWYVGGLTGEITIPTEGLAGGKWGLSHWTLFEGNVTTPDGGTTATLLGLGLTGLAGLRARFGRK